MYDDPARVSDPLGDEGEEANGCCNFLLQPFVNLLVGEPTEEKRAVEAANKTGQQITAAAGGVEAGFINTLTFGTSNIDPIASGYTDEQLALHYSGVQFGQAAASFIDVPTLPETPGLASASDGTIALPSVKLPISAPPAAKVDISGSNSRAGKSFTPKEKEKVIDANKAKNNGNTVCENCGANTTKPAKSQRGVTPPKTDTQVDHVKAKSKGGSGTADNGQVLCRDCNIKKSNN